MRRLPLVILSVLLSSCALGPDYRRPDISAPGAFRMAGAEGEATSIANLPWWEILRDDELQDLVRIALKENKDLQQAVASVEEFQARLSIARTDFAPQASADANAPAFGRLNPTSIPGFPTPSSYYVRGNLSWELDIWGRVRRANEAARAELLSREENRRAVVLELVSGVAQAYFDLRQLDMQLDIARRTLQSWEESVRIAQARLRQGLIPRLDADQFEAERANAASRAAELKRQMVQKEDELRVLLGRDPPPGATAHRAGNAARGAGRPALRAPPAPPGHPPGRTRTGGGHRPDRGRPGRAVSEAHAHGTPWCGESAIIESWKW
jgi:outer membrane protein, multidrug efflux system